MARSAPKSSTSLLKHTSISNNIYGVSYVSLFVGAVVVVVFTFSALYDLVWRINSFEHPSDPEPDYHSANTAVLVETIPSGLPSTYAPIGQPTVDAWVELIESARNSIDILAFYVTLTAQSGGNDAEGRRVLTALTGAVTRGVHLRVLADAGMHSSGNSWDYDTICALPNTTCRLIDFPAVFGGGIQHAKVIIADQGTEVLAPPSATPPSVYIGSANMDYRALAHVRETGLYLKSRSVAADAAAVFHLFWVLAHSPRTSPTDILDKSVYHGNLDHPLPLSLSGRLIRGHIGASPLGVPPPLSTELDDMLAMIMDAEDELTICAMEFTPYAMYSDRKEYNDILDVHLRRAASRGVAVRVLVGRWKADSVVDDRTVRYWRSLNDLADVDVRVLTYPPSDIPYSRVFHAKFITADRRRGWISTSNFTPDYFTSSGGVSFMLESSDPTATTPLVTELVESFDRDWDCEYAKNVEEAFPRE